jgi:CIC family chloride channel protein
MAGVVTLVRKWRSEVWMAGLAIGVGLIAGYGAVAFRLLIAMFHNLFFAGRFSVTYDALEHTGPSRWGVFIVLVPVVGALGVVYLVRRFAPEAKGHGVPEVIDAIHFKGGRIRPRVAAVKALASSISIGSGGSIGREGPIIQIGATFGSILAGWLNLAEWQRLALIAAGGGAGIAATFNTPIGGVLFAAEILLVEISARTLIPVMIATGTASVIGRIYFGDHPSFVIPALSVDPGSMPDIRLVAYILLGLVLGLMGWLYTKAIYWAEDLFERLPVNDYVRHVIGMALVGVTMVVLVTTMGHYYVEGVGYAAIQDILDGVLTAGWVLVLLAFLKLASTSLTLGSGASGGVFSPALFIGATMGGALATLINAAVPSMHLNPVNAAVVGMACMVGASTGAAVTAVVMIFEMTRDFQVILPLIIAVSAAYLIRRALMVDTIYTFKLTRRGQTVPASLQSQLYLARGALEFIQMPFSLAPADGTLLDLPTNRVRRPMHVVLESDDGSVAGVIAAPDLAEARRRATTDLPLADLAQPRQAFAPLDAQILDVMALLRHGGATIVIFTDDGEPAPARAVKGILTQQNVVDATNFAAPGSRAERSHSVEATSTPV